MRDWTFDYLLYRGCVEDAMPMAGFKALLRSGERIKIYQGFDPTTPHMHIGHLVALRVLRWFQLQGHHVIFLIGDATGMVGDPTGRSEKREMLTFEIVDRNQATYRKQAGLILDFERENPVEILRNSDWLLKLTFEEILHLMTKTTVQRLLERSMFQERMAAGEPLYYVETIYPLLQGYDSVHMEVDAELGGRDQLFNMMMGRNLLKEYLGKEKFVLTHPLLPGLDGEKMSKTRGNTIDFEAPPAEMFDKMMQLHDELIVRYFELLTDVSEGELVEIERSVERDPLGMKERLAFEVVKMLHSEADADAAQREFVRVKREEKLPSEIQEVTIPASAFLEGPIKIVNVLADSNPGIVSSRSEARRLIEQRGVTFDGKRVEDIELQLDAGDVDGKVVRIGKWRFYQVKVE